MIQMKRIEVQQVSGAGRSTGAGEINRGKMDISVLKQAFQNGADVPVTDAGQIAALNQLKGGSVIEKPVKLELGGGTATLFENPKGVPPGNYVHIVNGSIAPPGNNKWVRLDPVAMPLLATAKNVDGYTAALTAGKSQELTKANREMLLKFAAGLEPKNLAQYKIAQIPDGDRFMRVNEVMAPGAIGFQQNISISIPEGVLAPGAKVDPNAGVKGVYITFSADTNEAGGTFGPFDATKSPGTYNK
jgi:hypothetical protein